MTRPRVLITAPFAPAYVDLLREFADVVVREPRMDGTSLAEQDLGDDLATANVVIVELDKVDEAALAAAPELSLVVSCRAQPVTVDLEACAARGVAVATTPGRNADVTADFTMALMLATVRQLSRAESWMRSREWKPEDVFEPYETFRGMGLTGRTLGVIGGGAIGSRVVKRARGFDMNVLVYDPYLSEDHFGDMAHVASLEDALSQSDIVTIHVPLIPQTVGMIGAEQLALLKPEAILINAGRAAIIDEEALMTVLRERRIAAAGFDVFYEEPIAPDHELFDMPHVTLTPHIAGASDDVVAGHSRIALAAVQAWHAGEPIPHRA